jgi:hypothetical protein
MSENFSIIKYIFYNEKQDELKSSGEKTCLDIWSLAS